MQSIFTSDSSTPTPSPRMSGNDSPLLDAYSEAVLRGQRRRESTRAISSSPLTILPLNRSTTSTDGLRSIGPAKLLPSPFFAKEKYGTSTPFPRSNRQTKGRRHREEEP